MGTSCCWADYLPLIGPAPLRFEPIKAAPAPQVTLTHVEKYVPANTTTNADVVTELRGWQIDWFSSNPFSPYVDSPATIENSGAITNYVRSGPPALEPPEPALEFVTPQMMVHYFPPSGTNVPLASIPITFVPPQPPARPSSKAMYQVAPQTTEASK